MKRAPKNPPSEGARLHPRLGGRQGPGLVIPDPPAKEVRPPGTRLGERLGELQEAGQVADSPNGHGAEWAQRPILAHSLQPVANHPHVVEAEPPDSLLEKASLSIPRLQQGHPSAGPDNRKRDPRKAGAAPHVEQGTRRHGGAGGQVERIENVAREYDGAITAGDE